MSISNIIGTTQASAIAYPKKTTAQQFIAATQAQPYKGNDTVTISQAAKDQQAASQTSSTSAKSTSNYDFTNMTPNQMRDVSQDLFNSGKISSQQNLLLLTTSFVGSFPATKDYTPPTDADIARHNNTPINYVQYSKDRINFLESAGLTSDPQYGYESWKGLLAIFHGTTSGSVA